MWRCLAAILAAFVVRRVSLHHSGLKRRSLSLVSDGCGPRGRYCESASLSGLGRLARKQRRCTCRGSSHHVRSGLDHALHWYESMAVSTIHRIVSFKDRTLLDKSFLAFRTLILVSGHADSFHFYCITVRLAMPPLSASARVCFAVEGVVGRHQLDMPTSCSGGDVKALRYFLKAHGSVSHHACDGLAVLPTLLAQPVPPCGCGRHAPLGATREAGPTCGAATY